MQYMRKRVKKLIFFSKPLPDLYCAKVDIYYYCYTIMSGNARIIRSKEVKTLKSSKFHNARVMLFAGSVAQLGLSVRLITERSRVQISPGLLLCGSDVGKAGKNMFVRGFLL